MKDAEKCGAWFCGGRCGHGGVQRSGELFFDLSCLLPFYAGGNGACDVSGDRTFSQKYFAVPDFLQHAVYVCKGAVFSRDHNVYL